MPITPDYSVVADRVQEERYVYSCGGCGAVLDVRKAFATPDGILESLLGACPSCGAKLEDSIDCRLGPAPEGWQGPRPPTERATPRHKRPLFQCASSYNRFSLDFSRLDALLQPIAPGNLLMLQGRGASAVAELLTFRAQLPRERGGLDSTTVFIDGGNRSDPYLSASLARRYGQDTRKALRRVINCRVFTTYQLASLLSDGAMEIVETYGSKLLVIADLLGTFNEPDMSQSEADRLLDAMRAGIMDAKKKMIVVATLGAPSKYDEVVAPWSDTLIRLSPTRGGRTQANLRHPTKKENSAEFSMNGLLFHPDSPMEAVR